MPNTLTFPVLMFSRFLHGVSEVAFAPAVAGTPGVTFFPADASAPGVLVVSCALLLLASLFLPAPRLLLCLIEFVNPAAALI